MPRKVRRVRQSSADFFRLTSGVHRQHFSHTGFERTEGARRLVCKEGVLFLRTRVEEIRPPTERKDEQTSGSQHD